MERTATSPIMNIGELRENRWDRVRITLGRLAITVGVAGIVIPILPGTPLLLLGVWMLGPDHPATRSARRWLASFETGRRRANDAPTTTTSRRPETSQRWVALLPEGPT